MARLRRLARAGERLKGRTIGPQVGRDPTRIEEITERTYREIALDPRYSYANAITMVDRAIDAAFRAEMTASKNAYSDVAFRLAYLAGVAAWSRRLSRVALEGLRWPLINVALGWMPAPSRDIAAPCPVKRGNR